MPTFTHIAVDASAGFTSLEGDHHWQNAVGAWVAGPGTGSAVVNCNGFNILYNAATAVGQTVEFYNVAPFTGGNSTALINILTTLSCYGSLIFHDACQLNIVGLSNPVFYLETSATLDLYFSMTLETGASLVISTGAYVYMYPGITHSLYGSISLLGEIYNWCSLDFSSTELLTGGGTIHLQSNSASYFDVNAIGVNIATDNVDVIPPTNKVKSGTLYNGDLSTGDAPASTFLPFTSTPTNIGPYSVGNGNVGPYPVV